MLALCDTGGRRGPPGIFCGKAFTAKVGSGVDDSEDDADTTSLISPATISEAGGEGEAIVSRGGEAGATGSSIGTGTVLLVAPVSFLVVGSRMGMATPSSPSPVP